MKVASPVRRGAVGKGLETEPRLPPTLQHFSQSTEQYPSYSAHQRRSRVYSDAVR